VKPAAWRAVPYFLVELCMYTSYVHNPMIYKSFLQFVEAYIGKLSLSVRGKRGTDREDVVRVRCVCSA
jgi:hypothetical protein